MKIDTAGTYTLRYSATDQCGNVATKDRVLTVASKRTVLYSDGMFIINELPQDRAENEALHGAATNEYIPFDPNGASQAERYEFIGDLSANKRLWENEIRAIKKVLVGSPINPTDMRDWFKECYFLTDADLSNIDTSRVTVMLNLFADCYALTSVVGIDKFDTRNVTNFMQMFYNCDAMESIDVSSFDTSNAQTTYQMFARCDLLQTIIASSSFDLSNATDTNMMFQWSSNIVGGSGTRYNSSYLDGTYARIDNPPTAPGYFTAKTA